MNLLNSRLFFVVGLLSLGVSIYVNFGEQIYLQLEGDIDAEFVDPVINCGKLFEPVLEDKPWVGSYTLGFANVTSKFYIQYEFTYPHKPHRLQVTKWQIAPESIIAEKRDDIILFRPRLSWFFGIRPIRLHPPYPHISNQTRGINFEDCWVYEPILNGGVGTQ